VVGGGDSGDVAFVPQTFPNPARPNNVIAPIWADLNPAFGGAIRADLVGDGVSTWIVVDYSAVRNYGGLTTHTYEAWIRVGTAPGSEQISLVYSSTANASTGDGDINWGAENRDGTSGKNIASAPANNTTYLVTLNPPTAGGTRTITFDAWSKKVGTYSSVAAMTSDVTPGTTQVIQVLTVTP
jgi:hypothetical protein